MESLIGSGARRTQEGLGNSGEEAEQRCLDVLSMIEESLDSCDRDLKRLAAEAVLAVLALFSDGEEASTSLRRRLPGPQAPELLPKAARLLNRMNASVAGDVKPDDPFGHARTTALNLLAQGGDTHQERAARMKAMEFLVRGGGEQSTEGGAELRTTTTERKATVAPLTLFLRNSVDNRDWDIIGDALRLLASHPSPKQDEYVANQLVDRVPSLARNNRQVDTLRFVREVTRHGVFEVCVPAAKILAESVGPLATVRVLNASLATESKGEYSEEDQRIKRRKLAAFRGLQKLAFLPERGPEDVGGLDPIAQELYCTNEGREGVQLLQEKIQALVQQVGDMGSPAEQKEKAAEKAHIKTIIKILSRQNDPVRLLYYFRQFKDTNHVPDAELVNDILFYFVKDKDARGVSATLQVMEIYNVKPNEETYALLIEYFGMVLFQEDRLSDEEVNANYDSTQVVDIVCEHLPVLGMSLQSDKISAALIRYTACLGNARMTWELISNLVDEKKREGDCEVVASEDDTGDHDPSQEQHLGSLFPESILAVLVFASELDGSSGTFSMMEQLKRIGLETPLLHPRICEHVICAYLSGERLDDALQLVKAAAEANVVLSEEIFSRIFRELRLRSQDLQIYLDLLELMKSLRIPRGPQVYQYVIPELTAQMDGDGLEEVLYDLMDQWIIPIGANEWDSRDTSRKSKDFHRPSAVIVEDGAVMENEEESHNTVVTMLLEGLGATGRLVSAEELVSELENIPTEKMDLYTYALVSAYKK